MKLLLILLLLLPATSQAQWYGAASVGQSSGDVNGAAYSVSLGHQFNRNFALEGGFASIGKLERSVVTPASGKTPAKTTITEDRTDGFQLLAVGSLPLTKQASGLALYGLAGVFDGDFTFGGGLKHPLSKQFDIRVQAQRYQTNPDVTVFSLGGVYRF